MNCDAIAPLYQWMEYAVFGKALERCRLSHLERLKAPRQALVVGDGDGRFLKALALRFPKTSIDYVDASGAMLALARRRLGFRQGAPINFFQRDVRAIDLPDRRYDFIACHFFFDVFAQAELAEVVHHIAAAAAPEAQWLVSEFDVPSGEIQRLGAKLLLRVMYRFFHISTGLVNQKLPDWRPSLESEGFSRESASKQRGGFIVSELWARRL